MCARSSAPFVWVHTLLELAGVKTCEVLGVELKTLPVKGASNGPPMPTGMLFVVATRPAAASAPVSTRAASRGPAAKQLPPAPPAKQMCRPKVAVTKENRPAGEPIGMTRPKLWSPEVEDAFRLSEAGYRGIPELLLLGLPEPERWPETGFIRKLQTRKSFESGGFILQYYTRQPECDSRHLHRVKLYQFE